MLSDEDRLDVSDVVGRMKRRFNVLGRLDAGGAESLRREFHKPIVVHIHGLDDVGFPLVRFVER